MNNSQKSSPEFDQQFEVWMDANMMSYEFVEDDVIFIPEFGKLYYYDSESTNGIFEPTELDKKNKVVKVGLTLPVPAGELIDDEIYYAIVKWGDNFYYSDIRENFDPKILKYLGVCSEVNEGVDYINLGIHSPYELLEGSHMLEEWVKKAKFFNHSAIGICDHNTMGGTLPLQRACQKEGLGFVFGYTLEVRISEELGFEGKIYCSTNEGWANLLRIQKTVMVDNFEDPHISIDELVNWAKGNVFVFSNTSAPIIDEGIVSEIKDMFDDVYYQIDLNEFKADRFDKEVLDATQLYLSEYRDTISPVLISDNYYLDADDAKNKIILNKIDTGSAKKQSDQQYYKHINEHIDTIEPLFGDNVDYMDTLIEEAATSTKIIAKKAKAAIETGVVYMPEYEMTPEELKKYETKQNMFLDLLEDGFERLVPEGKEDIYRERLSDEVYIIESTNNIEYFLVTWDTVNWARSNDIQAGTGRGSAGGSLVSYLLGIITIDPMRYDLIFERFLTPERCGLEPQDVTTIGDEVELNAGEEFIEIETENGILRVLPESEFRIKRGDEVMDSRADELLESDEIILDRRDEIWEIDKILVNED